jgi:hypothetical protein
VPNAQAQGPPLPVGPGHLAEKGVRVEAEPEHGDAQHPFRAEDDLVRPEGVAHRVEGEGVVPAVDLHDEARRLPRHVEVDAPAGQPAHDLAAGLGQAPAPAEGGEVELAERLCAVRDVAHDAGDEGPPRRAAEPGPDLEERARGDEALLQREAEQQRRLPVGPRPLRGVDRGPGRGHPRQGAARPLERRHPAMATDAGDDVAPVVRRERHVDVVEPVAHHAPGDEGGRAVEDGAGPRLPHGPPQQRVGPRASVSDEDGVSPEPGPPAGRHLAGDVVARDAGRSQLGAVGDTAVSTGQPRADGVPELAWLANRPRPHDGRVPETAASTSHPYTGAVRSAPLTS